MKKKIVTLCLAAALAVTAIGGTLAYFTDKEDVTNTFTVGDIDIKLDEEKVSEDGKPVNPDGERTEDGNKYHLFPGGEYTKDPTVTVFKDSEESYIRMLVKVENLAQLKAAFPESKFPTYYKGELFLLEKIVAGWNEDTWECVKFENDTYEFRYKETVSTVGTADKKLEPLFTSIVIPGELDNDAIANLNNVKIVVTANAIQKDGFDSADAAWAEFK